jgi:hypothetical protein
MFCDIIATQPAKCGMTILLTELSSWGRRKGLAVAAGGQNERPTVARRNEVTECEK